MEFSLVSLSDKKAADVLVIPFWKGPKHGQCAVDAGSLSRHLDPILDTGDFKGKEGETFFVYERTLPEKRILMLGLGDKEKTTPETFRRAYATATRACTAKKLSSLHVWLPKNLNETLMRGVAEGLLLTNYVYEGSKRPTSESPAATRLIKIAFIGGTKAHLAAAKKALAIMEGVVYARDLVNGNADDVTPQHLVKCAKELAKRFSHLKTTIFDKKRIEKEKMGLLLAVNRGSHLDPAVIIIEYKGAPRSKDHTVVVGKGITYDTGGLNLKTSNMEIMKCDMGGGAACLGLIVAASLLKLPVNLTIVVPTTENGIDATSYKPGDVYTSYLGTTVEMMNSDAEGRLVLADALAYAVEHLNPTRLIDIATLTGAIEIALGSEATGLMSNDDKLAKALIHAGEITHERLWRMPLYDEYKDKLKSDIADIKSWNGRAASSSVAATFLQAFVGKTPWAHLDIAGTAFLTDAKKTQPKYATGVGVRLLVEFLEAL